MARNLKDSERQIKRSAARYHRKFFAAFGASLPVEDLEQEFRIIWIRVEKSFDSERGVPFEAFLERSLKNKALALAQFHMRRKGIEPVAHLDAVVGEDMTMMDIISNDNEPEDERMVREERTEFLMERINPKLRKMVALLMEPPEELLKEVEAGKAQVEYAASMGMEVIARPRVSLPMLCDLFGVSRCGRYRLLNELNEAMKDYDR